MSDEANHSSLEERIAQLEREVGELKRLRAADRPTGPQAEQSHPGRETPDVPPRPFTSPRRPPKEPIDWSARAEGMLGRVGVAFLVLALGFLFKYSFDQGWITPAARVLLGVVGGAAMIVVGLRLEDTRRRYAAILLGGGIAILYVSGYAAYSLYNLVPWAITFSFMVTVTLVALVLAERQDHPSLASLGASGGLATPFLLSSGSGNIPGLVSFACLVLIGAGTVQFRRGWRSLLGVLAFGGFWVMVLAVSRGSSEMRLITTIGVLVLWAVTAASPIVRRWAHDRDPTRWPLPRLGNQSAVRTASFDGLLMPVLAIALSVAGAMMIGVIWDWDQEWMGRFLFTIGAGSFVLMAWAFADSHPARNAAAESAAAVAAIGLWIGVNQDWVALPQALEATLLLMVAGQWGMRGLGFIGHALFAFLGVWFVGVAFEPLGLRVLDGQWLAHLGQLGAIILAFVAGNQASARVRRIYLGSVHAAVLLWLYSVFSPFNNGRALVTLTWGIYGIGLLVTSFLVNQRGIQLAGLATLGLVAGKLVLVDMAQMDMIWRILMFLGFGLAFLVLSYAINRRDSTAPETGNAESGQPTPTV